MNSDDKDDGPSGAAHDEADRGAGDPPDVSPGLWGGRFAEGMASAMEILNRSLDVDRRLWRQDIRGSRAWASALTRARVISREEGETLDRGLAAVARRLEESGVPAHALDEDIHTLIERLLHEEAGPVAGKLHTGRSRNDQVATDFRLWGMESMARIDAHLLRLCQALLTLAEAGVDLIMPGYTHLQRAQPIRAAQWALAHFWPFVRDRDRVRSALESAAVLPLGSGALAGAPFSVDREFLREELGFRAVTENSLDAVSDRDWAAELAFAGAVVGTHLSRVGEDLVLFASSEMGFVRVSDRFSTGSSLMPQKRNPDVAELVRGKSGRLTGNLVSLLTLLKGLPTGYNRDLQEDKAAVFDSVDTLETVLPALAGALEEAEFKGDRMSQALDVQMLATDLADYLVGRGVPFRRAHEIVGGLVRLAEDRGCGIDELADSDFRRAHPAFDEGFRDAFQWEASVEARDLPGGTSRSSVLRQIEEGRERLRGQLA